MTGERAGVFITNSHPSLTELLLRSPGALAGLHADQIPSVARDCSQAETKLPPPARTVRGDVWGGLVGYECATNDVWSTLRAARKEHHRFGERDFGVLQG